jgi:hypothetical protein
MENEASGSRRPVGVRPRRPQSQAETRMARARARRLIGGDEISQLVNVNIICRYL